MIKKRKDIVATFSDHFRLTEIFTCDITKMRSIPHNFINCELSLLFTHGDVFYKFNGENNNVFELY